MFKRFDERHIPIAIYSVVLRYTFLVYLHHKRKSIRTTVFIIYTIIPLTVSFALYSMTLPFIGRCLCLPVSVATAIQELVSHRLLILEAIKD